MLISPSSYQKGFRQGRATKHSCPCEKDTKLTMLRDRKAKLTGKLVLTDFSKEVGMAASDRQFSSSRSVLSRGHFDTSSWMFEI